jgi:hypothetical protein
MQWWTSLVSTVVIFFSGIFGITQVPPVGQAIQVAPSTQTQSQTTVPAVQPTANIPAQNMSGQMGSNISGHWVFIATTTSPATIAGPASATFEYRAKQDSEGDYQYFSNDPAFEVLYTPSGSATPYAKDKNHVYFQGGPLGQIDFSGDAPVRIPMAGVDPSTFTVLFDNQGQPTAYSEDKNAVYYTGCGDEACATTVVANADPSTFESVYSTTPPVGDIDSYGKDKIHVFDGDQIIPGANPATFSVILGPGYETGFTKDKSDVWYAYNFDGAQIYKINDADPVTFVVMRVTEYGTEYAKDKNQVYLVTGNSQNPISVISGADPATFTIVQNTNSQSTFDARDKNHEYLGGQIVQ